VDVDSLFADLLAMAPPDGPVATTSWKDCKMTGKEVAVECYNLNPVDLKECEARGKEAAKACYKKKGKEYKEYKDYYKSKGEEYKDLYKTPPEDVDSLFADLLAMPAPDGPITNWKDCKVTGKGLAVECYNLNHVDLKECEARGKEAAKACYKEMGKEYKAYKDYYKAKGKEYKDYYKTKGKEYKEEYKDFYKTP
jgi:hypothetical protein